MINNKFLWVFLPVLFFSSYISYSYAYIPPTNAYSTITTPNGTVQATDYFANVKFQPMNGMTITADNATQTIFFSGGHITPVGDRFGWFAVNTSPNLQNQHFYNFSTGHGISAFVGTDDFILSAIDFVNATSKVCGPNEFISAYDNNTGIFVCSPSSGNGITQINNKTGPTISILRGASHNVTIQNGSNTITIDANNTAQVTNVGTANGFGLWVTRDNATQNSFRSITCGVAITCSTNATNLRINSTAIRSINSQLGPGITIQGTGNNITATTTLNTVTLNTGSNVVVTDNSPQNITKAITLDNVALGANMNAHNFKINNLANPGVKTDAVNAQVLGLLGFLTSGAACSNGQALTYQSSNSTWVCHTLMNQTAISSINSQTGPSIVIEKGPLHNVSITNQTNLIIIDANNTAQVTNVGTANGLGLQVSRTNATNNNLRSITCTSPIVCSTNATNFRINSTAITSAITSINGNSAAAQTIAGTARNVTVTDTGATHTINLGDLVIVTNGANQRVKKVLTQEIPEMVGLGIANIYKNAAYTVTASDIKVDVNATACGNPCKLTLPSPSSVTNQTFIITKIDYGTNQLMITTSSASDTLIDGFNNYNLTNAKDTLTVTSNSTLYNSHGYTAPIGSLHTKGTSLNRWATSATVNYTPSTGAPSTTTLNVQPFIIAKPIKTDQISLEVSTLVAGSTCRMGIYSDNGTGYPAFLISGSDVGTVSGASTGVKTNTFTTPIKLQAGLYWLANQCSTATTIQLRTIPAAAIPNVIGIVSSMGATASDTGWSVTNTFGAFPHAFPSSSPAITTGAVIELALRITG